MLPAFFLGFSSFYHKQAPNKGIRGLDLNTENRTASSYDKFELF
jgi:hypothetical protein